MSGIGTLLRLSSRASPSATLPLKQKKREIATALFDLALFLMQEMGLEPTHSHLRQILSLMRLPFRHSCLTTNIIISYPKAFDKSFFQILYILYLPVDLRQSVLF